MGGLPVPASWTLRCLGPPEKSFSTEVSRSVVVLLPATLRVRLHLRERVLDLLAVLVAVPSVFVALPFPGVLHMFPMLVGLPFFLSFGAGALVDVCEVEGAGLVENPRLGC